MDARSCKHFTGLANARCRAGVAYADVRIEHESRAASDGTRFIASVPCRSDSNLADARCDLYEEPTAEEIQREQAEWEEAMELMNRGISPCCRASIDESEVIRGGPHDGHGRRTCSKCGEVVFLV